MGTSELKIYLLIEHSGDSLPVCVVDKMVTDKENPPRLVWCNDSLYRTLSSNTVKHILRMYRDSNMLPQIDTKKDTIVIYWDVMVPLDEANF